MVQVGIIGALGYGGAELIRILAKHPDVELTYLCTEAYKGGDISEALPNLRGFLEARCEEYDPDAAVEKCQILFLAQHAGWAMREAGRFLEAGVKVIDLSADFRLRDVAVYQQWYEMTHESPTLVGWAVYGLPEIYAPLIRNARLVANPGCYPTGAILALAPLLDERLIDPDTIVVDSKSAASGAGRSSLKLDYHFPEMNESMRAYNVGVHRHTPEIEQELSCVAGRPVLISFTPHLIPITRGILTTAYASLCDPGLTAEVIVDRFRAYYANAPFVVVLDPGEYPATKDTFASNFCHIGLKVDERTNRIVVISALDNLGKGMAGQAVQNMNLMCSFDERTGLNSPGILP